MDTPETRKRDVEAGTATCLCCGAGIGHNDTGLCADCWGTQEIDGMDPGDWIDAMTLD